MVRNSPRGTHGECSGFGGGIRRLVQGTEVQLGGRVCPRSSGCSLFACVPPRGKLQRMQEWDTVWNGGSACGLALQGDLVLLVQEAGCAPGEWGGHCTPSDPPASPL